MSMDRHITLHQPAQLDIGAGAARTVGAWAINAGATRILVLTAPEVEHHISSLGLPGTVQVISNIPPEPSDAALADVVARAAQLKPDLVIGLGGGSIMDMAKLVSVLWDGAQSLDDVIGPNRVATKLSKLVQIATTAGTGSEAGIRALITNSKTNAKMAVESPLMRADLAVLDPTLTYSIPPAVTAATGVDAMAHCVEAFTNIRAHDMIDGFARAGIGLVGKYLQRAVEKGDDTEARNGMMLASYYGGICLGPVNTAAGHALAYPLGTQLSLPHGLANAIIFPHVLAFNAPSEPDKTSEIMAALGLSITSNPQDVFENAYGFCEALGIEMRLSAHGAEKSQLSDWAQEAHAIRRLMDNNPRAMSVANVEAIYTAAF